MNAVVQLLVKHGYSVLFASVFARQMFFASTGSSVLIAAGALAGSGRLTLAVASASPSLPVCWPTWCDEAGRRWVTRSCTSFMASRATRMRRSPVERDFRPTRASDSHARQVSWDWTRQRLPSWLSGTSRSASLPLTPLEPLSGRCVWRLGYVLGKDLDRAAAYAARLGTLWVVVVLSALAMYVAASLFGGIVLYANFGWRGSARRA